ncbi:Mur ligase family protein [Tistrella mobilis]|uniref:bifunctional folylpolyglutamate synthase/dihydrofolate synthase n=1 Tax=Tistrella mobilis TaxID=171437 RepID=UPI003556777E
MDDSATILDRLGRLHATEIELGFDRILRLLADLGNPQDRLPPVIHLAGTNGKGSVVACLAAIARAAGLCAHAYTSPHLVRFHERIALGGRPIAEPVLARLLARIEEVNAGRPITFFEITTAAAFLAFAETPADLAILETGLGGRLDATNLVARPAAVGITRIALDHMEFLGDTPALIAAEKAAIIKQGRPAATVAQTPDAAAVIRAAALRMQAPFTEGGRDWQASLDADRLVISGGPAAGAWPLPALIGDHQAWNAGLALTLARLAAADIPALAPLGRADALAEGLRTTRHPGRLQPVTAEIARALPALDPAGRHEIWIDGGHNPDAVDALVRHSLGPWSDRPLQLVLGLLARKDATAVIAGLAPLAGRVRLATIAIPGHPSHDPDMLAGLARRAGIDAAPAAGWQAAIAAADPDIAHRILIFGSLYLVGDVLAAVEPADAEAAA